MFMQSFLLIAESSMTTPIALEHDNVRQVSRQLLSTFRNTLALGGDGADLECVAGCRIRLWTGMRSPPGQPVFARLGKKKTLTTDGCSPEASDVETNSPWMAGTREAIMRLAQRTNVFRI